jgi:hypothetical protein
LTTPVVLVADAPEVHWYCTSVSTQRSVVLLSTVDARDAADASDAVVHVIAWALDP